MPKKSVKTQKQLVAENEELRARLDEAEETLHAIRSGEVDALIVSGVDGDQIFTLKQAEDALQKEKDRAQQYLDIASVMFVVLATDRKVILINKKGCEILGYDEQEIVGRSWFDFLPQDEKDRVGGTFDQVMVGKIELMEYFENSVLTKSGQERLIAWHNSVMADEAGKVISIVSSGEDITERKRAEQEIVSLAKFPSENPYPVLRLSRDGILMYANVASGALLGLWGCTMGGTVPQFWRDLAAQALARRENKTVDIECDGKVYSIIVTPVTESGYVNLYGRDITERKQSEERIRRQLEHLTALSAIDRFIASVFDLKLCLSEILNHVTKELSVDAADIWILNPNSQMLEYSAERGFRSKAVRKVQVRLSEIYAGRAVLERHLIQIPNLRNEPNNLFVTTLLTDEDFVCYYGVPLIFKGHVNGVMEVFHRASLEPDAEWFNFLFALAGQAAIAIENATLFENLQRSNSELIMAYDATIEGWSQAMDLRDKETEGHTQRVTEMTVKLAGVLGLSEAEQVQVRWGALLHDIGKMGVPDGILLKPGPLTDEEWVAMKKHPTFAHEMLAPIRYLRLALDIPYCHHEKWDGTGYPRGLKGTQIPLAARIFAVVDVWDALTSDRPYREAWSKEKTIAHIKSGSGTHFDPQVVDVFMQNPNLMLMHPPPGGLGINASSKPLSS